jgi:hypothetical protein
MSEIIGTEKVFLKNAVITEKDIPSSNMSIKNLGKKEGKDLYGFFVTKDEFSEKLSSIYCSDGLYDVPIVRLGEGEEIILQEKKSRESLQLSLFDKKVLEGTFIKQSEISVEKQLKDMNIPIRKIRFWNKLGWAFAK